MSETEPTPNQADALVSNQRAKQRLVGAIAFFVVMLLLLPLVLHDRHPKIQAPLITTPPQAVPSPASAAPPTVAATPSPTTDTLATPITQPDETPQTASKPSHDTSPAPNNSATVEQTDTAPQATPPVTPVGPARYTVQLGVFTNQENALALQSQLKAQGFSVKLGAVGRSTRIRVGEFAHRKEALDTLNAIKSAGFTDATIVSIQP